jgi:hypothetical protein
MKWHIVWRGWEGGRVSIHSADRQVLVSERKDNKGEIPAYFREYFVNMNEAPYFTEGMGRG